MTRSIGTVGRDEEFIPEWWAGPHASWKAIREGLKHFVVEAKASGDVRLQMFAEMQPWLRGQIRRFRGMRDGSIQFPNEDLTQQFYLILWEAVCEWTAEAEKADSPAFRRNAGGVVIRKAQARIRKWYREQRTRYHIERALIVDDSDEPSLAEYKHGLEKEAASAATPRERRRAQTALKVVVQIGDRVDEAAKREAAAVEEARRRFDTEVHTRMALAALNERVIDDSQYDLLAHEGSYSTLNPHLLGEGKTRDFARLRQAKRRARQRLERWAETPPGRRAARTIAERLHDSHPAGKALRRAIDNLSLYDAEWGENGYFLWEEL